MRTPAEDLLESYSSAVMATGMQRRLARAVCTPPGIEHLEDPGVLDQLSSASGELTSTRPADAPMTLASAIGDRLGGLGACVVLATFRWWLGLLFLAGWLVIRPPLRRLLAERALLTRRATPALRHSWYYLGCAWRPQFAKEMRVFGLGDWILGRHQERWIHGMAPSWAAMSRLNRRVLALGDWSRSCTGAGTGALEATRVPARGRTRHTAVIAMMAMPAGRQRGVGGRRGAGADVAPCRIWTASSASSAFSVGRSGPGRSGHEQAARDCLRSIRLNRSVTATRTATTGLDEAGSSCPRASRPPGRAQQGGQDRTFPCSPGCAADRRRVLVDTELRDLDARGCSAGSPWSTRTSPAIRWRAGERGSAHGLTASPDDAATTGGSQGDTDDAAGPGRGAAQTAAVGGRACHIPGWDTRLSM
jgi:hypothetical protein